MTADKKPGASSLWENWLDTLKAASVPLGSTAMMEQWQRAMGAAAKTTPADFFQASMGDQQALLRLTELAAETIRSAGSPADGAAVDSAESLERSAENFRAKFSVSPMTNALDLWLANAAQFQRSAEPWTQFMQRSMSLAAMMGSPAGAGDPLGDALERSFGLLANFPGINQELPQLLTEAAANAAALAAARENYRVILAATWQRAFEEIGREVLKRTAERRPVQTSAALLSLSTTVADRVFVETFSSQRYVEAQERLSTALADQRRHEMKVVDLFARFGHFPTRRDLDEVVREISVLRREVHALKRTLRSAASVPPAGAAGAPPSANGGAAPAAAPRSARKTARKSPGSAKKAEHGA
ncbi:MAG: poly(R)-hydroxyalkanoic acid synthase subunit PhaE [Candidatus Velthaea sp.]|jgi:class III poly(R)-hydroxyalkanoic acid synthase PhaE subunit